MKNLIIIIAFSILMIPCSQNSNFRKQKHLKLRMKTSKATGKFLSSNVKKTMKEQRVF